MIMKVVNRLTKSVGVILKGPDRFIAAIKRLTDGKDTREILEELGFSDQEITEMLDAGVVSESWSKQYLPD